MTQPSKPTSDLIAQLAAEPVPAKPALNPARQIIWLLAVLLIYAFGAQIYLGLRPDLINRLTDAWFEAEIVALWFLILTSSIASIIAMAPDAYQKPVLLQLPYVVFAALIGILGYQMLQSPDMPKLISELSDTAGMECSICIALVSMLPSAFVFAILKRGASVRPFMAGSYAVFTAAGIGCLTLRLAEPIDSLMHVTQWHYMPTLLFAILGAFIGKWLLKW